VRGRESGGLNGIKVSRERHCVNGKEREAWGEGEGLQKLLREEKGKEQRGEDIR
jgi:hypothetical protein